MSLFLFLKQIVDMFYAYKWLDYAMVGMVLIALAYQLLLVRPDIKKSLTVSDLCICGFIVLVTAAYFKGMEGGYAIYVKVLSGFLLYFVGRIYYERIKECESAIALSSYVVVYANFIHRLRWAGSDLFNVHEASGDLYYYDIDLTFALLVAFIFIMMYARNNILKLLTVCLVIPYMIFYANAGTQQVMFLVVMALFLLYFMEKVGVNRKICNVIFEVSIVGLLILIIDMTLPVFMGKKESFFANVLGERFVSSSNLHDRYGFWSRVVRAYRSATPFEKIFGSGLGESLGVNSQYLKILYVTGLAGIALVIILIGGLIYRALIINDRKTYYITIMLALVFFGTGVIVNCMESTQMSWFLMMFLGMTISSIQVEHELRLERNSSVKARVCMLGQKHMPSREGGVEIVVEELSTRMASKGYELMCFNRSGRHVSGKKFKNEKVRKYKGVSTMVVPTINKKGLAATSASISGSIFACLGNYDIVHFHAEGNCMLMWLVKWCGKKCIATVHGLDHQRAKWGKFARWYILQSEKVMVKHADEIIVLSENVKEYFKKKYNRETTFIPNGVNKPEIKEANIITEKYGLTKDSYILYLGRIVPEKGISYLLEAYKELKERYGGVMPKKLVIAGGASDTADYQKELVDMAEGDENIIFTDFIQGEILDELYSNAYIYVFPSDLEGMPLSLLEAMSYGNCCLISDIPECTSVVEDRAMSFRHGSVANLATRLDKLLQDNTLVSKYKAGAAEYIFEKYDWEMVVDKTINLYEEDVD